MLLCPLCKLLRDSTACADLSVIELTLGTKHGIVQLNAGQHNKCSLGCRCTYAALPEVHLPLLDASSPMKHPTEA